MNMTPQPRTNRRSRPASARGSLRIRSRRVALIGAVVVLGLTACGSADSNGSSAGSTLPAPAVIQIAGSASGPAGGASPMAADMATESSKMMAMPYSYVWTGTTPDLTSPAASWYFAPGVAPTADQAEQLAAAFGVSGEPVAVAADMGGGWTVGPNDGSAPSITIAGDAMQSWWYSPAWQTDASTSVGCAYPSEGGVAIDATGDTDATDGTVVIDPVPVCEEPQPPAGVPSKADAEAKAREMLSTLGGDPASYELDTYADEWGASTTSFLMLDGVRTNLSFNIGYGEQGAVTWAGGFLAAPQRGADYPRIGVEAAIQRLNDQANSWMTGYGPVMRDAGLAVEAAPDAVAGSSGSAVAGGSNPLTEITEIVTEPSTGPAVVVGEVPIGEVPIDVEPIVMTLTTVTGSLEQVWAADGTVWLLPGYSFGGAEGLLANVLAVEDQYLQQAEPQVLVDPVPLPEPMPVETAVAGTAVVEPAPAAPFDVVGLSVDDATSAATEVAWEVRVAREDGVDLPVTADFRENRINVAIEAGVITEVLSIG